MVLDDGKLVEYDPMTRGSSRYTCDQDILGRILEGVDLLFRLILGFVCLRLFGQRRAVSTLELELLLVVAG